MNQGQREEFKNFGLEIDLRNNLVNTLLFKGFYLLESETLPILHYFDREEVQYFRHFRNLRAQSSSNQLE